MLAFSFAIDADGRRLVSVVVYDAAGRLVARPIRPVLLAPGPYSAWWRGDDLAGRHAPPGMYIVEFRAGDDLVRRIVRRHHAGT